MAGVLAIPTSRGGLLNLSVEKDLSESINVYRLEISPKLPFLVSSCVFLNQKIAQEAFATFL